jgi:hypothetical protein
MKSLRFIFLTAIVLACAFSAIAQQSSCALKQAPEFRGFRLGMTSLDVRAKLEDSTLFDANMASSKAAGQGVRISAAELKESLAEGIDEINLAFIDGRVAMIKVTYSSAMTWDGGQDFLLKESQSLGLPKPSAANSTGSTGNEKYKVECKAFAVSLAYSFGVSPNITINDMAAQKIADQRLNDEKEVKQIIIGPGTRTGRP